MLAAVLCSSAATAERMLISLWDDRALPGPKTPAADGARLLIDQLAQIVGARKQRLEIDRVLDQLATKSNDAGGRELREGLILALARGARRSGGRLQAGSAATNPGARLLKGMIDETKTAVLDDRAPEAARVAAIARLGTLDPVESPIVLVKLLEPREPLAVQVAAVRTFAESDSAEAARILLPRLRGFEPSVRTAVIQTLLTRADWSKALLEAISRNDPASGLSPGLIEPADHAPLLKHRDAEIARFAQKLFGQPASQSRGAGDL